MAIKERGFLVFLIKEFRGNKTIAYLKKIMLIVWSFRLYVY